MVHVDLGEQLDHHGSHSEVVSILAGLTRHDMAFKVLSCIFLQGLVQFGPLQLTLSVGGREVVVRECVKTVYTVWGEVVAKDSVCVKAGRRCGVAILCV